MIVEKKDSTFELKIAYSEYKNGVFYGTVEAKNLDCDPDVKQVNFSYSEDSKVFLIPFIDSDYNRKWLEGKYDHYVRANDFLTKFSKEIEKFITDSYEARIRNDEFTIKALAGGDQMDISFKVDTYGYGDVYKDGKSIISIALPDEMIFAYDTKDSVYKEAEGLRDAIKKAIQKGQDETSFCGTDFSLSECEKLTDTEWHLITESIADYYIEEHGIGKPVFNVPTILQKKAQKTLTEVKKSVATVKTANVTVHPEAPNHKRDTGRL